MTSTLWARHDADHCEAVPMSFTGRSCGPSEPASLRSSKSAGVEHTTGRTFSRSSRGLLPVRAQRARVFGNACRRPDAALAG